MATLKVTKPVFGATSHPTKHNVPYFTSIVIDYTTQTHASTDVIEAITIPANTMVIACGIDVLTLDAGTGKIDLVDSVHSNTYVAALEPSAAGQMLHSNAIGALGSTEVFVSYDATDTLDVTHSVAVLTTAVIRVWAIMCDYTDPIEAQRVTIA